MSAPPSNRQRRRRSRAGAAVLRDRPGWDPLRTAVEGAVERLARTERAVDADAMQARTADCAACAARRRELSDETALCDEHFAALLGM